MQRTGRARSRALFDLLAEDAYYAQPIALRHPIVFYEGHLAAFSFNTLVKRALGCPSIDERLERRERAVDGDHLRMPEVVFLPGFMQHADAWSPVAAAVGERYPSKIVDFSTWTFDGRLEEICGLSHLI